MRAPIKEGNYLSEIKRKEFISLLDKMNQSDRGV